MYKRNTKPLLMHYTEEERDFLSDVAQEATEKVGSEVSQTLIGRYAVRMLQKNPKFRNMVIREIKANTGVVSAR